MGAMECVQRGGLAKIDAAAHAGPRVRGAEVWLTQPSILQLYEADPIGLRQAIERRARAARSARVYAACASLVRAAARLLRRAALA
jgi:hypothetical protein